MWSRCHSMGGNIYRLGAKKRERKRGRGAHQWRVSACALTCRPPSVLRFAYVAQCHLGCCFRFIMTERRASSMRFQLILFWFWLRIFRVYSPKVKRTLYILHQDPETMAATKVRHAERYQRYWKKTKRLTFLIVRCCARRRKPFVVFVVAAGSFSRQAGSSRLHLFLAVRIHSYLLVCIA